MKKPNTIHARGEAVLAEYEKRGPGVTLVDAGCHSCPLSLICLSVPAALLFQCGRCWNLQIGQANGLSAPRKTEECHVSLPGFECKRARVIWSHQCTQDELEFWRKPRD
jgi:hypothetical protein